MTEELITTDQWMDIGLSLFWLRHKKRAKEMAGDVVEGSVGDCYLDEFIVTDFDGKVEYATVRVLLLDEREERKAELRHVAERLRVILGCKIDLWICVSGEHIYPEGQGEI